MPGLEESRLFGSLSPEELKLLEETAERIAFPPETVVFHEGEPGNGIYVVESGAVRISALVAGGERRVLARVGPGDFFGEMAVLDEEPRSASATVEGNTTVRFIPRSALLELIERSPRLAVSLVREFSLRMRDFNQQYIREVLEAERLALVGRFARTIVHDFKNPLNIIGLAADLMDMEKASPEMRKTASGRIRKQVERLTNMINELLEFTRSSQGRVMHPALNYRQYLEKLIEEYRPELADKRIQLQVELPSPEIFVLGDGKRLIHVFSNLFHNAADAMIEGGEIKVRCFVNGGEMITEVADTGVGIAPEIMGNLFDAFASFGKAKGTGLGLSICRRIIEDHRGIITARNGAGGMETGGAIFTFSLPILEAGKSAN